MVKQRVCVVGAGSWGTAVAGHMAKQGNEVRLWSHNPEVARSINEEHTNPVYLPACKLGENVVSSTDHAWCLEGADAVLFVVPSSHLRSVARDCSPFIAPDLPVCVLTKGIEYGSNKLMTEVVEDELTGRNRIACLSGPNHAEEVCLDMPAGAVAASSDLACAEYFKDLFNADLFRTYVSTDEVGVEVCAAAKNVVAIACGVVKGLSFGDNTLSVIMTRGLAEMSRIVAARGGDPMTCMGLAGMGDLVATCTSAHSRNQTFGAALAKGETLESYEARTHMVVEGARACRSILHMARELGVEVPLTEAVHSLLYEGTPLPEIAETLFRRTPRMEFYGLD